MEDADVILLNTCHIREKAAEKVYSDLGRIRQVKDARRSAGKDTIVAVAGCVAQARGRRDRAPRAGRRSGRGPAELSPPGRARSPARRSEGRRIVETGFPEEDKFAALPERAPAKRGDGVPHRAGGLRQVLHLLRRALHARRRVLAPASPMWRPRPARLADQRRARDHAARARTSTPITALGPDGRPLVAGAADRAGWPRIDGIERMRYTTSHPARHGRRPDRGASPSSPS